jgi:hypothetical protein
MSNASKPELRIFRRGSSLMDREQKGYFRSQT